MNNFEKIEQPLQAEETLEPLGAMNITQGIRRDGSAREIPLEAATEMIDLRFEKTAIRKDFGDRILPGPNIGKILALVEHKFIDSSFQYSRIVRAARDGQGRLKTQIWDADEEVWVDDAVSTVTVDERYVRAISTQGVLLFAAKGRSVLVREEEVITELREYDFPAGNSLESLGDSTELTVTPLEKLVPGTVTIRYDVEIDLTVGNSARIWVAMKVNGVEKERHSYVSESGDTQPKEFTTQYLDGFDLEEGDILSLEVVDAEGIAPDRVVASVPFIGLASGPVDERTAPKGGDSAENDAFFFEIEIQTSTSEVLVEYYADTGGGWNKYGEKTFPPGFSEVDSETVIIPGAGVGTLFGYVRTVLSGGGIPVLDGVKVSWHEPGSAAFTFSVHGYNEAFDGDLFPGLQLTDEIGVEVSLEPIDGAPDALWIEPFGDRVIALRDGVDPQVFSWTVDGNVLDWTSLDSGQIFLVDARNDPLDPLQSAAPLSSNILAVFRSRSIMRAFESGNVDQSVGAVHWIENLGTESPFSVEATLGGICFLGHDMMVYMLTEQGPTPIGQPIHQELIERVTGRLELVDAEYDPAFQEYYLGVPEGNSSIINRTYIFDVGSWFRSGGEIVRWRSKSGEVQRYAVVSEL